MKGPFEAVEVSENVYWVGAIDWHLRDFHGYATERGSTYNAYLIMADKITLVDTVKASFIDEMLSRIASVVSPDKIDYVISNHSEMDHSGALPAVMHRLKPEKVFASANGVAALDAHFHKGVAATAVADGETVSLGNANVTFYETRMLHWPDSMFTFLDKGGVLFSQDALGMHLASAERFADEIDGSILEIEAKKYFANILTPFSALVTDLLERVGELDLPIRCIAPDHGPIFRRDLSWILELYAKCAAQIPTNGTVIVYDTMWGSTDKMGRAIAEGVLEAGGTVELFNMSVAHRSDVATAVLDAGALVVGSPTINGMLFPTIAGLLSSLRGLRPKNLVGAAFGSYGWSGEAVGQIEETLAAMSVERVSDSINVNYVPTNEDLAKCRELGKQVAARLAGSDRVLDLAESADKGRTTMEKYVCDICGYVYDPEKGDPDNGVKPGTAFEDLPDDWVCPKCKVGTDKFSLE